MIPELQTARERANEITRKNWSETKNTGAVSEQALNGNRNKLNSG